MSHRRKVWVALAAVYILWGSTYLGIALHWPRLLGIGLLAAGAALSLKK